MIEHALWLVNTGFAVVPLHEALPDGGCSCGRNPCSGKPGKHPRTPHGLKDCSRDPAQITAWWTAWPSANIAIVTGSASSAAVGGASLLVIDVDGAEGEASLALFGALPDTLEARTGKGRHLYFAAEPGFKNTQGALGLHVDTRGENGYVIAPPSMHASGARYEWLCMQAPAPLPSAIAAQLGNKRPQLPLSVGVPSQIPLADVDSVRGSKSLNEWVTAVSTAGSGKKHEVLRNAATAHACAAQESHEPREAAEPRITQLLLGALALNGGSQVDSWENASTSVRSALDKAYARPLPVLLHGYERELNEDGLARRFAKFYGPYASGLGATPSCLFVPGQGWRMWDGRRWAEQPGNGRPTELVSKMLIELHASFSKEDEKLADLVKAKRSAGSMGSILALAQRYLSIGFDAFDRDPFRLNTLNGTVDLRTGSLSAYDPRDLITKCCGVGYAPQTTADGWTNALRMMQHGDESAVEYLRVLLGSFCQGQPIDGFWLMHGNGFDGKSTVLDVMHAVLGSYAQAVNPSSVLVSKSGQKPHTSIMGGLAGTRLGTIDEMPSDCQLDTGAIKSYFGRLPVRMQTGMGKDFVDVRPTAKGLAASNHLPRVDESDFGTQRRIAVIPFPGLRPLGVRKDDGFALRLVAQEGPAILAWLVSGCSTWLTSGGALPPCERVRIATEELFGEGDVVGTFLETCMYDASTSCAAGELYGAYKNFAESQGDFVCSKRAFGNRCRERGLTPHKGGKGSRMYNGVRPPVGTAPPIKP